ncbi:Trk system potassium transporter TrkA [Aureimonas populi]|uniref:Trk system potassium uptake protein TrkA n=1 Tax=Aureimonas populi TaxID=1701758 RepID=A0ABW5CPB5_9HYPH|nr:Trk system potassium transporter TrkA [Aureimonas populi]
MRIVICGAGQVGYGIAQRLAAEGHDLSVIDTAPALIERVRETIDARAIVGHGAHPEVLAEAGANEADMLIAVTLHDEVNMVACQVAHTIFEVPTKIGRIRSQSYLRSHVQDLFTDDAVPIDVIISPEVEVGEVILRRIAMPGAVDVVHFAGDAIVMVGIECQPDSPLLGVSLRDLSTRHADLGATTVGIVRGERLLIPDSETALQPGDLAYVVADGREIGRVLEIFGHKEPKAGRIVIAGGGSIGYYVARQMEKREMSTRLRVIEAGRERAMEISERLRQTIVLNGSALDHAILNEADADDADLMVAVTNDDQVNLLSSVMAKQLGCRSSLALVTDPTFQALTHTLGIDAYVNPRQVTISRVLQHVRRGRIRAVHSVQNGLAEIIEAEALETSPLVGQALKDLALPDGLRIGGICREGRFIRPVGETRIRAQDRVVIFAAAGAIRKVEQMFRVSLEFF